MSSITVFLILQKGTLVCVVSHVNFGKGIVTENDKTVLRDEVEVIVLFICCAHLFFFIPKS